MSPRSRIPVVAGFLLLLTLAGVAIVAGAPPPTQLCATCDSSYAESPPPGSSYAESPIPGATGAGTLDIRVDETGDSRWIERVPVDSAAADRYRDDPDDLERAVEDAWEQYNAADGDVRDREIELVADPGDERTDSGGTVVVSYRVDGVAKPGVGDGWIVDYFALGASNHRYGLEADRVSIHPPDGHELTTKPAEASVEDGAATWRRGDDFGEQTYLTYGPDDGIVGAASGWASIALETGPTRLRYGVLGGVLPAAVLGTAAFAIGRVDGSTSVVGRLDRDVRDLGVERLGRAVVGLGVLAGVGALLLGTIQVGTPLAPGAVAIAAAAFGYGAAGGLAAAVGERAGRRGLLAVVPLVAVGASVVTVLLAGRPIPPTPIAVAASAVAFLPFGFAVERGEPRWSALAGILVPQFAIVAAVAPIYVWGFDTWGPFLFGLVLVPTAIVAAGAGYPLWALGRRLAG